MNFVVNIKMEDINLFKINTETIYLKEIKKNSLLFKHTAEGTKFTKIHKNKITTILLNTFFTNFNKPMYETLLPGLPTKIYLDCDFTNLTLPQFLEKDKIINKLNNYLIKFLNNKYINTSNIIYSDASRKKNNGTYKISLHIVVNNVYIKNRKILKELIKDFQSTLLNDILYYKAIDTSVYNQPQLFKCLLSPSKDDNTLLKPFKIEDNNITYYDNNYIISNIYDFLVGLYHFENNFIDNILNYTITENVKKIKKNTNKSINPNINKTIISENKKKWILNSKYVKNIYNLKDDNIVNNKINLIRINSSYCEICDREHTSENAYCMVNNNSIFFHCGRNPSKGVGIGFWYNNYKGSNNNNAINKGTNTDISMDTYNNLNNIIKEMKDYIRNLENKYNKIKEEFNLCFNNTINTNITKNTTNKCTKKYTKDINSEMWQKYYKLGKYVDEGLDDLVEKIRCQWRDGSWGRLKKRGLLIYEYINYINKNNIINTISMRKIFHKKDYEPLHTLL